MNNIGEFISQRRKDCGLTQKQLAEVLHLTSSAISKWETGMAVPHISQFPQIAEALQIPVSELYALTIEDFHYQTTELNNEDNVSFSSEDSQDNTATDVQPGSPNCEKKLLRKPLFAIIGIVTLLLIVLGTTLYISKSSKRQPVLQIVDEYYSEEAISYGYSNIYYIIIDFKGNLSEDYLQSYKNELLSTYSDKFKQASIIIVKFYNDYSAFKTNEDPDMKLVLLPPRKE